MCHSLIKYTLKKYDYATMNSYDRRYDFFNLESYNL